MAGLREAYACVAAATRLGKSPAADFGGCANKHKHAWHRPTCPSKPWPARLTLLNAKTPHEQWPDIVVLAGVGVTTTLSNSLARD
jgi:hypothetical protein